MFLVQKMFCIQKMSFSFGILKIGIEDFFRASVFHNWKQVFS